MNVSRIVNWLGAVPRAKTHITRFAVLAQTPEPVFGVIKSVLGFRRFLLRGINNVRGEWGLVTMAWNIERMFVLAGTT